MTILGRRVVVSPTGLLFELARQSIHCVYVAAEYLFKRLHIEPKVSIHHVLPTGFGRRKSVHTIPNPLPGLKGNELSLDASPGVRERRKHSWKQQRFHNDQKIPRKVCIVVVT